MKLITWNVNGIRACINNGLLDYLQKADADIVAIQETKINTPMDDFSCLNYYAEWYGAQRPGYSGTLCLFKKKPLKATLGLNDKRFSDEGRIITLEYPSFFFINMYAPMSQGDLNRWTYRLGWDAALVKYILRLQKNKPVIICGDFNVAHHYIDIYPENYRNEEHPHGFLSEEREGFNKILETGLVDVFRKLHPEKEQYTWWSNRLKKRKQNRGWRIDYFLASDTIYDKVKSCKIRSDIYGSDHAPIEMEIDLEMMSEDALAKAWRDVNWKSAERRLLNLQRDIAYAAINGNREKIITAQNKLVQSATIGMLAVKHVCSSTPQPGIDGKKWETDAEKMSAALSLDPNNYTAQPMRMLIVATRGQTKQRYVQIPTYYDKAMQVLFAYALDPVSEVTAERTSFAFRKGRSTQDVHAHVVKSFNMKNPPRYVLKGDVKACYASISHDWLLKNIPMQKPVLREFLKAGYVFGGELFPPDDYGISLGSSISPILGNMVLDKMQREIYLELHGFETGIDYADGHLIRFADDVLVTARTKESATEIKKVLSLFLAERGLAFSEEKTIILDLAEGFDFLSRNYRLVGRKVYTAPSENAVAKMEQKMRDTISKYRGGQKALIEMVNKKLTGWASYHKITDAEEAFARIDMTVKASLLELCEKLHPVMTREKIINKYFYREPDGEWVYALENKPDVRIYRLVHTVMVNHYLKPLRQNPYINIEAYEKWTDEKAIAAVTGKYKAVWTRQKGTCLYCGKKILKDQHKDVIQLDQSKRRSSKNLAYIHEFCKSAQVEYYESDKDMSTPFDLYELLVQLHNQKQSARIRKNKFTNLTEHFLHRRETVFTLTFDEIEVILNQELCGAARANSGYWKKKGYYCISSCWLSNGYDIRSIDMEKQKVVFERTVNLGGVVTIPEVFLSKRIPHDAKVEVENMFDYIRKKYAL